MKDRLAKLNNKLVCFSTKEGDADVEKHGVVIDGSVYFLLGYQWQECFGIDKETGRPKILISRAHAPIDEKKEPRVAKIESEILKSLCNVLRHGHFDEDGKTTMKIGEIHCDVRILKPAPPKPPKVEQN